MVERKPEWLKVKLKSQGSILAVEKLLENLKLNTVCEESKCPNKIECFGAKTATFMILGKICTRNCAFCNIEKGMPQELDENEPENIAKAVEVLGLRHVVITSVTRDDLDDGGAGQFVRVIKEIRKMKKDVVVEVLIPDFKGDDSLIKDVVYAKPDILGHNVETVPSLYPLVRQKGDFKISIELLKKVKKFDNKMLTKSSFMLGLGETEQEILDLMKILRESDCDMLTIGQYLAPTEKHYKVRHYVEPEVFEKYKNIGYEMGFKKVESGPFVRSSYHAAESLEQMNTQINS